MKFCHLHTHSMYSLLDGLAKIDQLVAKAKEFEMPALALTDHGAMYGVIEFYQKAKEAGIKPILGVEMYLAPRKMTDKTPKLDTYPYHLVLLAKDNVGYQNLMQLVTLAHLQGYYYKPRVDKDVLRKYSKGLIALTACLQGEIPRLCLSGEIEKAKEAVKTYQEIFGKENFFLELQYHKELPEQQKANLILKKLAKETAAPLVATNDIHYVNTEDKEAHEVLLAVQTGKDIDDAERLTLKKLNLSMLSEEQMRVNFKDVPEATENTGKIFEKCNVELPLGKVILPKFEIPQRQTSRTLLEKLVLAGFRQRYGKENKLAKKRLKYELAIIEKTGFEDYFLIVQDFVNFAKEKGILVGPGRGSAAGSIVSYSLGITDIDPLEHGLLFERFLNPERIAPPDIDLDFEDSRRDEVIDYICRKYGHEHIAQIITFGTMASRGSVRDVGRALGMSYSDVDKIAKLIPFHLTLEQSLNAVPELLELYNADPQVKKLIDMAQKLEGVARHVSTHAAGIVLSKEPLIKYTPLQHGVRGEKEIITQYSMYDIEAIGLVKMDILGLANLSIIENTLKILQETKKIKLDLKKIPLDDQKTYQLLSAGNTTGVFQLECLAGDSIISNTTIKKLYERKNKKTLRSVYLNSGKVHNNKIISVAQSGVKKVYLLLLDNNRFIKATENHQFLTEEGWKKLKEIKKGEKVLIKLKSKCLIYNLCLNCQKQIDGQKNGKSKFCYQCSAKYYKNPSKKWVRKKISHSKTEFYRQGGKSWNLGLSKDKNQKLLETGQKISQSLTGRSLKARWGRKKFKAFKKMMAEKMKGHNNPMFGTISPHHNGGFRKDLGHYIRSSWEADFARILKLFKLKYEYEPKTFKLKDRNGDILHYTPDFYVKSINTFFEIKGWLHDLDRKKMQLFQRQYPHYNFILIDSVKFADFALKYKTLVNWECPKVPTGFEFAKVTEIKFFKEEMTYDIWMQSPGNNFIASSFVVHNSEGMKRYLKQLQPTEFSDIVAMVALYRPGPMQLIPDYILGKQGKRAITYLHPKLEPILKDTFGIAVYQEQILQIAKDIAGFTLGEADILRKAVGKKIKRLLMQQQRKFVEGAIKNGIRKEIAERIFRFIEPFARYGFNKSHAVCYAQIAYQTAYLKANFPSEFMTALLNNEQDDLDKLAVAISEAERLGIAVLPADVNLSLVDFSLVKDSPNIRYGLAAIKNVGRAAAENIVLERQKNGSFKSLEDFAIRLTSQILNKKIVESLAKSGALDCLGERNQILAATPEILKIASGIQVEEAQLGLFGKEKIKELKIALPNVEPALKKQKLSWEKEYLGTYLSEHPLAEVNHIIEKNATSIAGLNDDRLGQKIKVGGIITSVSKIITKNGEPMLFAQLEDTTGQTEIIVFPKILKKNILLWQPDNIVLVEGETQSKDGKIKIIATKIEDLGKQEKLEVKESVPKVKKQHLQIRLPSYTNKEMLSKVKEILISHPGESKVLLRLYKNGEKIFKTKIKVDICQEILQALNKLLGKDCVKIIEEG